MEEIVTEFAFDRTDIIELEGNRETKQRQELSIVSGDSVSLAVEVFEKDGTPATVTGSELVWVLATHTHPDDREILLQKDSNDNGIITENTLPNWLLINIDPQDTEALDGGLFVHEVEERRNGRVNTLLQGKVRIRSDLS